MAGRQARLSDGMDLGQHSLVIGVTMWVATRLFGTTFWSVLTAACPSSFPRQAGGATTRAGRPASARWQSLRCRAAWAARPVGQGPRPCRGDGGECRCGHHHVRRAAIQTGAQSCTWALMPMLHLSLMDRRLTNVPEIFRPRPEHRGESVARGLCRAPDGAASLPYPFARPDPDVREPSRCRGDRRRLIVAALSSGESVSRTRPVDWHKPRTDA